MEACDRGKLAEAGWTILRLDVPGKAIFRLTDNVNGGWSLVSRHASQTEARREFERLRAQPMTIGDN